PQRTRTPEMERAAIGDPGDEGASGQRRGREVVPASGNRRTSRPRARTAYATSVSIHSAIMLPPLCLAEHETELRDRTLEKRVSEQRIEDVGDRADEDELVGIRRGHRCGDETGVAIARALEILGAPPRVSDSLASTAPLRDKPA